MHKFRLDSRRKQSYIFTHLLNHTPPVPRKTNTALNQSTTPTRTPHQTPPSAATHHPRSHSQTASSNTSSLASRSADKDRFRLLCRRIYSRSVGGISRRSSLWGKDNKVSKAVLGELIRMKKDNINTHMITSVTLLDMDLENDDNDPSISSITLEVEYPRLIVRT